jgi:hypothetical protein
VRVERTSKSMKNNSMATLPVLALIGFLALPAAAADLKPETLSAWNDYLQIADARLQEHLQSGACFLKIDEAPDLARLAHGGEIVISPVGPHAPKRVPGGLIHDWDGVAFFPNTKIEDVIRVSRDYEHYKDYFRPTVISARGLGGASSDDRFSMVLMNRSLFDHKALDGTFESKTVQVDAKRWYSVTRSTRIQQIDHYGEPEQQRVPVDSGEGFIWRLYTVTRYEERDGGVYAEVEALGLSRDVPSSVRWMIDQIIRRISRSSLTTSLRQTRDAIDTVAARGPSVPTGAAGFRQ